MYSHPETEIPRPWLSYLHCQQCKRSIVEALGLAYLRKAGHQLTRGQSFILAGCFSGEQQDMAWEIENGRIPKPITSFQSNAQEADMRVWRHALQTPSTCKRILIYSPDTDVYNIGLTLVHKQSDRNIVV